MPHEKSRFPTVRDLYRALQYENPSSEKSLTSQQTAAIDIPSLLQGRSEYWIAPFGNTIKNKKIIIANTKKVAISNEREIFTLCERLQHLEKEGYIVYRDDDCASVAKKTGRNQDEIVTLDEPELRQLVEGDDEDWKKLGSYSDVNLAYSNISKTSLENLLREKANEMIKLDLSGCINLGDGNVRLPEKFNSLRVLKFFDEKKEIRDSDSEFPHNSSLTIDVIYKFIKLAGNKLEEIYFPKNFPMTDSIVDLLKNNANLKKISLPGSSVSVDQLWDIFQNKPRLEEISLLKNKNIDQSAFKKDLDLPNLKKFNTTVHGAMLYFNLVRILKKTKMLSELDLEHSDYDDIKILLDSLDLSNLIKINLSGSDISTEILGRILKSAKQLEEIDLTCLHHIDTGQLPDDINLSNLKKIILNSSYISQNNLEIILKTASKLEDLDLSYSIKLDINSLLNSLKLSNLKNIKLSGLSISLDTLWNILKTAEKLESLDLSGCKITGIGQLPHELNLPNLKSIKLAGSNIPENILWGILEKAKQLEKLDLSHFKNIAFNQFPKHLNLSNLKVIKLSDSSISADDFWKILKSANQLEEIDLSLCKKIGTGQLPDDLFFPKLREINIDQSSISSEILIGIIKNTTNLKTLRLHTDHDIAIDLDKISYGMSLLNLKEISIRNSSLSGKSLSGILMKPMRLENLYITNCKNIDYNQLSPKLSLLNLRRFHATGSCNSESDFSTILNASPYLKNLYLTDFKNISFESLSSKLSLCNLSYIGFSNTTISIENLSRLINSARGLKRLDFLGDTKLVSTTGISIADYLETLKKRGIDVFGGAVFSERYMPPVFSKPYIPSAYSYHSSNLSQSQNSSKTILTSKAAYTASSQKILDADTTPNPKATFKLDRIFFGRTIPNPSPSDYRLSVFDTLDINKKHCDIHNAFSLKNKSSELKLTPQISIQRANSDLFSTLPAMPEPNGVMYYGKCTLNLSKTWLPLPSLSADEILQQYHLSDPDCFVEIQKSERDHLYYIRTTDNSKNIDIDFTILVPHRHLTANDLPALTQEIIKECTKFDHKKLNIQDLPATPTGQDYLNLLKKQKVGACRHRTAVFKAWMEEKQSEIPVRIVNNDCHSFVEVYHNKSWITVNLGGYSAQLQIDETKKPCLSSETKIDESNKPSDSSEPAPKPTIVTLEPTGTIKQKKHYFSKPVPKSLPSSSREYIQTLLQSDNKKMLLKVSSPEDIAGIRSAVTQYCHHNSQHPYFYIHKPEDLICASAYIACDENQNTGRIHSGPGGTLYDFLKQYENSHTKPVLIVNFSNFTSRDLVRFNALLDPKAKADGTALPINTKIIGLYDPQKPGAYNGSDFFSRFDYAETVPLSSKQLTAPAIATTASAHAEEKENADVEVDLYGGEHWKEQLLGRWDLHGNQLVFQEGILISALRQNKTGIILKNAPWENDAFASFWQNTLLTNTFSYQGVTHKLPKNFALQKSAREGYAFSSKLDQIEVAESPKLSSDTFVLNRSTLSQFYGHYVCQEDHSILSGPGILKQHENKTIPVYLSHTLPNAAVAQLLDACQKHHVRLRLCRSEIARLPDDFSKSISIVQQPSYDLWDTGIAKQKTTCYCHTTDSDVISAQLEKSENAIILDISEMSIGNLIGTIDGKLDTKKLTFYFENKKGILTDLLNTEKTVVLTGHYTEEMQEYLTQYVLARSQQDQAKGKLILLSEKPLSFPVIHSYHHTATIEEKKSLLSDFENIDESLINNHTLSQLKAIARHFKMHPTNLHAQAPWQGMKTLPAIEKKSQDSFQIDLEPSSLAKKAETFDQDRITKVHAVLKQSPFVFLAGMTGVGKTTFAQNVWKKEHPHIYFGEEDIARWAEDKNKGIKTLFIDEANISSKNWTAFEALFRDPPFIVVNNKKMDLSADHKVIFAGNPLSYGDERQMPSLFERHGNSVIFDPITPEYIAYNMLLPVIDNKKIQDAIIQPILAVAHYMMQISNKDILITPRELTMMALLSTQFCQKNQSASASAAAQSPIDPGDVAKYYAYHLAKSFIPEEHRDEFNEKFEAKEIHPDRKNSLNKNDILISDANRLAHHALEDFLSLRKARASNQLAQSGGLGGVILEGSPGAGKSELVTQTLVAHKLSEGKIIKTKYNNPYQELSKEGNVFYRMPASLALDEKKALLIKAFYEGAVVVVDEINSSPMMERFLNALLMQQVPADPDIQPQIKTYQEREIEPKPGFLLIGTQNPASMGGRSQASSALSHRMQTVKLPDYTEKEIADIILHRHPELTEETAKEIAAEYCEKRHEDANSICFRDVLRVASQIEDHVLSHQDTEIVKRILDEMEKYGLQNRPADKNLKLEDIVNWMELPDEESSKFFLATRIKKCCKQALTALGMSINSNNPVTAQEIKKSVGEKIKEENKSDSTATASATPK